MRIRGDGRETFVEGDWDGGVGGEEKREILKAVVEKANQGSLRELEKCGFARVKTFVESNGDELVEMEMRKPDD